MGLLYCFKWPKSPDSCGHLKQQWLMEKRCYFIDIDSHANLKISTNLKTTDLEIQLVHPSNHPRRPPPSPSIFYPFWPFWSSSNWRTRWQMEWPRPGCSIPPSSIHRLHHCCRFSFSHWHSYSFSILSTTKSKKVAKVWEAGSEAVAWVKHLYS